MLTIHHVLIKYLFVKLRYFRNFLLHDFISTYATLGRFGSQDKMLMNIPNKTPGDDMSWRPFFQKPLILIYVQMRKENEMCVD